MSELDYDAEVRHDGRLHSFTVAHLNIPVCDVCCERVFTEGVDKQISDALRIHLKLLAPAQIRDALNRIGVTQKEVAERLGIAEATISRWLNETQIQSRSLDRLLRAFFAFPKVRDALALDGIDPTLGTVDAEEAGLGSEQQPSRRHAERRHGRTEITPRTGGWNGSRESCRPVQEKIERSGSTWCLPERVA